MNCKLGDLVRYVGPNKYDRPNVRGWIGKVVGFAEIDDRGNFIWVVDPPLPGGVKYSPYGWSDGAWICDSGLRPINGGETPEESIEAMKKLHHIPNKETV